MNLVLVAANLDQISLCALNCAEAARAQDHEGFMREMEKFVELSKPLIEFIREVQA